MSRMTEVVTGREEDGPKEQSVSGRRRGWELSHTIFHLRQQESCRVGVTSVPSLPACADRCLRFLDPPGQY